MILSLALLLLLAGCAGPNVAVNTPHLNGHIAGFWQGIWNGATMGFCFIISLFTDNISIYEIHNTGWPYNLGFILGAGTLVGGASSTCKKR